MRRLFSATEALFVAFAEKHPISFSVTAHIRGTFSVEQLRAALTKVKQKHPYISARVVPSEEGWWYDTDGVPDFPIRCVEGEWAATLADDLTVKFVSEVGPLVRFVLATDEEFTDLTVVCQHGISDGLSGAYLLRDTLHYLGNPNAPVEPLQVVSPIDELLPTYDASQFDFSEPPPPVDPASRVRDNPTENPLYVLPWSLSEAQTGALVKRCRAEKTSIHAALSVAFLVAHERLGIGVAGVAPHMHTVSSPVSLRDRFTVPIGEHLGNYITSGIKTTLACEPSREFWDMAHEVKTSLTRNSGDIDVFKQLDFLLELTRHVPFDTLLNFDGPDDPADYDLSISNLGNLHFPVNYGPLRLEAMFGPAVNALLDEKVVGVATTAGTLTFTLVTRPKVMDRPTAERLRDITLEILSEAVG
jgi:hypothetical protein